MSYANDYNPTADFSQDETNNVAGRSNVRTQALDDELAAIAVSINALNDNLKLLQRDDGQFKDFSVGLYALSSQLRAFIAVAGSNPRGPWQTFTDYAARDVVDNAGIAYICWSAHTSGGSFDSANWIDISGDGSAAVSAANAEAYKIAAQASATAADTSADAAAASQVAAAASQVAAANSATNASASASTAAAQAAAASASATASATSAAASDVAKTAAQTAEANVTATVSGLTGLAVSQVPVRQTVLSGPVDSNGNANFGGSIGGTSVTASGTLIVTAANGFSTTGQSNRVGSITNPSWSSLTTNGTMYLYLDIAADGTCTTGSTTLAPVYQPGGTYSVANGQFTFNYREMIGTVGDGALANQTYRVFVGEVTVAANLVASITWYALHGRYMSATAAYSGSLGAQNFAHKIGITPKTFRAIAVCKNAVSNWAVGDEVPINVVQWTSGGYVMGINPLTANKTNVIYRAGNYATTICNNSGTLEQLSAANWNFRVEAERGW